MCGVVRQVREVKGLVDHTLPSKRCIPMQEDGHHLQNGGAMSGVVGGVVGGVTGGEGDGGSDGRGG